MFCRNCGIGLPDGAAFCANCGASQTDTAGGVATASDPINPGVDLSDELMLMVKQHLGGDYSIEKELGRGGMAVVYKGVEKALERIVAIKVVPPESANAGQAAERFRREARLAASLDHPNIIPVYRVGQAGPLHYMAMKFVEGRAVDAIIEQQGALPIPVAVAILKYSAAGLAFAHDKKIVHRDIKGANILVDKDGRVMVSDFGIARALEEVSLTASGMMIGTPYFMSPEQCGGQKVSPQSDQYSLGILGFQLLTGEVPFTADSMVGVIQHHYMTPVPDITVVRPDVPKELLDIIYCSLNKDPADRFASTKDMATAFENVPLSDAQREEAETVLRELSQGRAIPKVRTGTLPPLTLTISGPGPRIQPRPVTQPRARVAAPMPGKPVRKKRKNKKAGLMAAAFLGLTVLGGGALGVQQYQASQVRKQAEADSVANVRQQAVAASRGHVRFSGLPPRALIAIAGRAYTDSILPLDTGSHVADIRADGYQPLNAQLIEVRSLDTTVFEVRMLSVSVAQAPIGPQPSRPSAAQGAAPPVQTDSGDLRLEVTPLRAQVFLMPGNLALGSGRVFKRLPVGTHVLRYRADGCGAAIERTIQIRRDETLPMRDSIPGCSAR